MLRLVKENLSEAECEYFDTHIALVEPSIGRMVPATPKEIAEENPLAVCVEPYCELPVDKNAFKGEIPDIQNMVPFAPESDASSVEVSTCARERGVAEALATYSGVSKDTKTSETVSVFYNKIAEGVSIPNLI